jgi:aryl-alcohol dehydrogenase-like predicted oxidoreductase
LNVPRRTLGRTGLSLPVIGFGCGPTAGLIARGTGDAQRAAVARALELGIDFFDTAPLYGDGESERTLGRILGELGASPLIATKVLLSEDDLKDIGAAVAHSVEASRQRLGGARITLLLLHNRIAERRLPRTGDRVGPLLGIDDMLGAGGVADAFGRLRDAGIARFVGCSAYGGEMPAVGEVIDSGTFDCLSVHYSLLNTTAWMQTRPPPGQSDYACIGARAGEAGMGVIALRVLEAGRLAAGDPGTAPGSMRDGTRAHADPPANFPHSALTLTETAVRFALSRPDMTSALIGISSVAQVEAAAASASRGMLPDALLSRVTDWQTAAHKEMLT